MFYQVSAKQITVDFKEGSQCHLNRRGIANLCDAAGNAAAYFRGNSEAEFVDQSLEQELGEDRWSPFAEKKSSSLREEI